MKSLIAQVSDMVITVMVVINKLSPYEKADILCGLVYGLVISL